jgi:hypothetical protein
MRIARSTRIWIAVGGLAALLTTFAVGARTALAQTAAAAPAAQADLATRVADLEAYITNSAPKAMTT